MFEFKPLIQAGVTVAAISDESDGDCALQSQTQGTRTAFLRRAGIEVGHCNLVRQVHKANIVTATKQNSALSPAEPQEGDGLVTAETGVFIAVTVADCVPVLLFDPESGAVAALHAGRAGTLAQIARLGVEKLQSVFNTNPLNIHAVIGPSAGPCCYEVSAVIADQCRAQGMITRGRLLDLWESNHLQLCGAGLDSGKINVVGHCTLCQTGFWSYRRQETPARNLAVIGR